MKRSRRSWTFCLAIIFVVGCAATALRAETFVIRNVNVIPMDRERVLAQQDVVVRGNQIVSLGASGEKDPPSGARMIEGDGRYLLPGLVDMHAHLVDVEYFGVYLTNGITTTVNMNGSPDVLAVRDRVENGDVLGPRIFTTGPLVAGEDVRWSNRVIVKSPEEADSVVRDQAAAGYDFIKVYEGLDANTYRALLSRAEALGIPAIGHIPDKCHDNDLLSGQKAIHHLGSLFYYFFWPDLDVTRFADLARRLATSGRWVCPTLSLYDTMARITDDRTTLERRPEMRYVAPNTRKWWSKMEPGRDSHYALFSSLGRPLVRELHAAGVPLLAGTDHPNPYVVPGFALHDELAALHDAGLSRFEVLETATRNPGRFLGEPLGTICVGQLADLLLVASNPLDDLATLRRPEGVMANGRWLAKEHLSQLLTGLEDITGEEESQSQ